MILSQDVMSQAHGPRMPHTSPFAQLAQTSQAIIPVAIVSGLSAAPLLSLLGWIGLVAPARTLLHQVAPTLLICALLGLALAIIGAHLFHSERRSPATL